MPKETNLDEIATYYSDKIRTHGNAPEGVDWNGIESQAIRFEQLSKIIKSDETPFSMSDIGCGYGAYYDYLKSYGDANYDYHGYDISKDMIKAANDQYGTNHNAHFITGKHPNTKTDYVTASGIFNVQLKIDDTTWQNYIHETINMMNENSTKGFSFNCLTSYSDAPKMRDYLYYADPLKIFDFCKKNFSRNVALLHDYDLYEFTLLVRK
jgi:SAM-dependent methyltransferase